MADAADGRRRAAQARPVINQRARMHLSGRVEAAYFEALEASNPTTGGRGPAPYDPQSAPKSNAARSSGMSASNSADGFGAAMAAAPPGSKSPTRVECRSSNSPWLA